MALFWALLYGFKAPDPGPKARDPGPREPRDHNLREACRQYVAGHYLDLYDEREKSGQLASHMEKMLSEAKRAVEEASKALQKAEDVSKSAPFDIETNSQKSALEQRLKSLKDTQKTEEDLQVKAKTEAQKADGELAQFEKKITTVFKIDRLQDAQSGYRIYIDFHRACPPYRFSCPLSKEDAAGLRTLFDKQFPIGICGRYADFLQW